MCLYGGKAGDRVEIDPNRRQGHPLIRETYAAAIRLGLEMLSRHLTAISVTKRIKD